MMFRRSSNLALVLILTLFLQPSVAAATSSAAILPRMDGDMDSESRDLADALSDLMRLMTDHHIVDGAKAEQITRYRGGVQKTEPGDIQSLIASAKEHHFAFKHAAARRDIDEAIALLSGRPLDRETGPVALDAYLSKAMIAVSTGDDAGTEDGLRRALSIDPILDLSGKDYPPSLKERLTSLKAEMGANNSGALSVKSRPAAAEVYVNGIMQGVTPLELEGLPAGEYSLAVAANRYAPDERSIAVLPDTTVKIKSKLRWAKGAEAGGDGTVGSDVRSALDMADALKVEKVVMIDADAGSEGSLVISAQVVDRGLRTGLKPLVLPEVLPEYKHNQVAEMANMLVDQLGADPLDNPNEMIDPIGEGDPIVLGKRKKPLVKQPLFWGIVGTIVAGAVAGGIAASMSGGSGTGNLKVSFK
jgi:hypothetical protein